MYRIDIERAPECATAGGTDHTPGQQEPSLVTTGSYTQNCGSGTEFDIQCCLRMLTLTTVVAL